jgi:voltage-gated potassium channel Kch
VLFVIVSRFLSVYPLVVWGGGGSPRTGFITSLNLAQISEFSLVIATIGLSFGHIQREVLLLILYAMAITSILASYAIKYNYQIFRALYTMWSRTAAAGDTAIEKPAVHAHHPIMMLGYHLGARAMVSTIAKEKPELLQQLTVVDFNLEILQELKPLKIEGVFGDITSVDTLRHAGIEDARMILSTIPDVLLRGTDNLKLVKTARALAPHATIIATADFHTQVPELKAAGANDVLLPYELAGDHVAKAVLKWGREVHTHRRGSPGLAGAPG